MGVCILSSLLAFVCGFLFTLLCLVKCSDEKWQKFKDAVDKGRETEHGNQD